MPRKRPYRVKFPKLAEARMVAGYLAIWRTLARLVREQVLPVVRSIADDATRTDAPSDDVAAALARVRILFAREVSDGKIRNLCATVAGQVDRHSHLEQTGAGRVIGLDIVKTDRHVKTALPAWVRANTDLIKRSGGIVDDTARQVGDVARNGFAQGRRHEQIAKDIEARLGVAKSRAILIARDQTNKLNGQLAMSRQVAAGVERYAWSTSRDERVRQSHAVLEGQVFAWNGDPAPPEGHPGEPVQCRCVPLPTLQTAGGETMRPTPPTRGAPTPDELIDASRKPREPRAGQMRLPLRTAARIAARATSIVESRVKTTPPPQMIKPVDVDDATAPSIAESGQLSTNPAEALEQMRQTLLIPLAPGERITGTHGAKTRRRLTLRR